MLAGALAQHLDGEALGLGIARVHAVQVAGEDRGLVAAGAGAHLEEDVLVVARILRQQQQPQRFFFREQILLQAADLLVAELAHAGIGIGLQLARRREFALESW